MQWDFGWPLKKTDKPLTGKTVNKTAERIAINFGAERAAAEAQLTVAAA